MATASGDYAPIMNDYEYDYILPDEAYVHGSRRYHNDDDSSFRFYPPLYRQRYSAVINELRKDFKILDRVLDFGCAEGNFLYKLRDAMGRSLNWIIGVDLNEDVLKIAEIALTPEPISLFDNSVDETNNRCASYLFKGSIAEYDDRMATVDAVVAIELIEHLEEDVLRQAVDTIFARIRPYVVIFTTPNSEFNVLFNMGERRFRHDDHKFEWTRNEFQTWCQNIIEKYPKYRVQFSGVGRGPDGTGDSIGEASQIAVFRWKRSHSYLHMKDERDKKINEILKQNRFALDEHMTTPGTSESPLLINGDVHEHPYQFVSKILLPPYAAIRRRKKAALDDCLEYCRQVYAERLTMFEAADRDESVEDLIVRDPETNIRGTWIAIEELFALPGVQKACETISEVMPILWMNKCFSFQNCGFDFSVERILYRDEYDTDAYYDRMFSSCSDEDCDSEFFNEDLCNNKADGISDKICTMLDGCVIDEAVQSSVF